MKRLLLILTLLSLFYSGYAAWGLWDSDRSWIVFNLKGTPTTYSVWNNASGTIQNADLGTFLTGNTFQLTHYDIKTWKNDISDVTGGKFYYLIYPKGNRPGSPTFTSINFVFIADLGSDNQRWGIIDQTINLLAGLSNGEYTLEFYSEVYGTNPTQTLYDNNGGNPTNYTCHFRYNYVRSIDAALWASSSTWLNGIVPGSGETAEINTAVSIDGSTSCGGLIINSSKSLTINAGASLTMSSGATITNNAGVSGLVIKSDATGSGELIAHYSVAATVERYVTNADWTNGKDGWHFISSPVESQAIDPAFTTTLASEYDFYTWYEPGQVWVNYKNTSNEPTWWTANFSYDFKLAQGYLAAYNDGGTKQFTGNLNVGEVSFYGLSRALSGNHCGYHLMGNPFSCGLLWSTASNWALSNIDGVAKYWNESNQSYSDLTSEPESTIPSASGFMVRVTVGTGSLTIDPNMRVISALPGYKTTNPGIKLTARNIQENNAQESLLFFNPEATEGFDNMFDSEFLEGFGPLFYSVNNGLNLSTNTLPESISGTSIPFHFIKNGGTDFSIDVAGLETFDKSVIVSLVDKKTGTAQNLIENPVYNFTSSVGDDPARFELKFGTVGINDPTAKSTLNAWYSNGKLYLVNNQENTNIVVFNVQGHQVKQTLVQGIGLQTISLQLPVGIYFVQLVNNGYQQTLKIIVL